MLEPSESGLADSKRPEDGGRAAEQYLVDAWRSNGGGSKCRRTTLNEGKWNGEHVGKEVQHPANAGT
jgi:hypothetical protein